MAKLTDSLPKYRRHLSGQAVVTLSGADFYLGLCDLQRLRTLCLTGRPMTGAINDLTRLKGLRDVRLVGTRVTDDGVNEIRQRLPQCQVHR